MEPITSFELKSSQYVLTLVSDPDVPFEKLLSDVEEKFRRSARFFRNGQMAVCFRGRELTDGQKRQLAAAITKSCQLDIVCIIEETDPDTAGKQAELIAKSITDDAENSAVMVRHSLKNGEKLSFGRTVIILGNVSPGAEVASDGDIIVLGIAMGVLRAGHEGDEGSFIMATVLKPMEMSIGGKRVASAIRKKEIDFEYSPSPEIAYVKDGHIVHVPQSGKILEEILKKG